MSLHYACNELRRRRTRTVLTAFGLASGVGLVMGIVGVSAGLDQAQQEVLSPLSSAGTDILVTRTVAPTKAASASPSPSPSPSAATGQQQGGFFAGGPGGGSGRFVGGRDGASLASLNDADATALLNENSSVLTDLSKLGKAGTTFTHDFFLAGTLLTFPDQSLATVKGLDGVASATSALTLQAQHQTGTVPEIVASVKTGVEELTTTARPAEMTAAEQARRPTPAPPPGPQPESTRTAPPPAWSPPRTWHPAPGSPATARSRCWSARRTPPSSRCGPAGR